MNFNIEALTYKIKRENTFDIEYFYRYILNEKYMYFIIYYRTILIFVIFLLLSLLLLFKVQHKSF